MNIDSFSPQLNFKISTFMRSRSTEPRDSPRAKLPWQVVSVRPLGVVQGFCCIQRSRKMMSQKVDILVIFPESKYLGSVDHSSIFSCKFPCEACVLFFNVKHLMTLGFAFPWPALNHIHRPIMCLTAKACRINVQRVSRINRKLLPGEEHWTWGLDHLIFQRSIHQRVLSSTI